VDYVQEISPIEFGTWKNHSIQLNKKVKHLATFDQVDPWDEFETIIKKCKKIIAFMMNVGYSSHMKNGPTCKDKWGTINNDFKWIFGYMARNMHNEED
jgi:hypothetical protein